MPLLKSRSKKALEQNIETEMKSGKSKDQSLAVAFNVQRKAKSKKMAEGGKVERIDKEKAKGMVKGAMSGGPTVMEGLKNIKKGLGFAEGGFISKSGQQNLEDQEDNQELSFAPNNGPQQQPPNKYNELRPNRQGPSAPALKMLAEGGEISPEDEVEMMAHDSLAAAIMARRQRMAEGGMVNDKIDIMDNGKEIPNQYYGRNEEILKENLDAGMEGIEQMSDSNLIGDEREEMSENKHDSSLVGSIRSKMKRRRFIE